MNRRRSRFAPAVSDANEVLESRIALSGVAAGQGTAEIAAHSMRKAATKTTLVVNAGTLGQPITFNVTVRAPASAGAPEGTVNITDHKTAIGSVTLTPTTSTNPRFAYSQGTVTLDPPAGTPAPYFGRYTVTASFVPSGSFGKSQTKDNFIVNTPNYTSLSDGVEYATIGKGSGPQIQAGQTAAMLYTGYLTKTGQVFDDSANHGGTPFSFKVGARQVIPGFDEAVVGMQAGETRIVTIPPAEGYGSTANGPVPANSSLTFVIKLTGIS